jgi:hypothetical protein
VATKYSAIVTIKNMAAIEVYPLNFSGQSAEYWKENYIDAA